MNVQESNHKSGLNLCIPRPGEPWSLSQVELSNPCLEKMTAQERVQWAAEFLPPSPILTSSFGAQSAVMLHMVNSTIPGIPVVLIDTGYLFPETYSFIDELTERLGLNLNVFRPSLSPSWLERRYGRLWESGEEGIRRYNHISKVEPMKEALDSLNAGTWFSGLRRVQSRSRETTPILQVQGRAVKVHPLADWRDYDIHQYLKKHDLPYHPLWDQGYVSIGDIHTTRPLAEGMSEEETRFFGLLRECGVNEARYFNDDAATKQSEVKATVATG